MQYFSLPSRGGAAQPMSDLDFVHALIGGASAAVGGTGRKQRAVTSAGGVRAARSDSAGGKDSYASAYSKPRSSSAYRRATAQAW